MWFSFVLHDFLLRFVGHLIREPTGYEKIMNPGLRDEEGYRCSTGYRGSLLHSLSLLHKTTKLTTLLDEIRKQEDGASRCRSSSL